VDIHKEIVTGLGAAIIAAIPEPFFVFDEEGRYVEKKNTSGSSPCCCRMK
jgi:hypothetical protein